MTSNFRRNFASNDTINQSRAYRKCASSVDLVKLVLKFFMPDLWSAYRMDVQVFLSFMLDVVQSRGVAYGVTLMKNYRLIVLRSIGGQPFEDFPGIPLSGGWPTRLAGLSELRRSPEGIRFLVTVLWTFRGIRLPIKVDLTSITEISKADCSIDDRDFVMICRWLGIPKHKEVSWSEFHMTSKAGPNGPALMTSMTDLHALTIQQVTDLRVLGGKGLGDVMDEIKCSQVVTFADGKAGSRSDLWNCMYPPKADPCTRKLVAFADKEGKTRVVAIGDYWAQSALKPYHKELSNILRKLPNDCTYDQGLFFSYLQGYPEYHSLDLSNATDRMPLALQKRIFSYAFGEEKADAWARTLVGEPYRYKGRPYAYGAGQPMGLYSSWASMALCHHFILKWAGLKAGKRDTKCYVILGDDVVIADRAVATEYRNLLRKLDMPWNESKTHTSCDLYEFAKRLIWKGHEVTPFAIPGLSEVYKSYGPMAEFLISQESHGWTIDPEDKPAFIISLHRHFVPRKSFVKNKVLSQLFLMEISRGLHDVQSRKEYTEMLTLLAPGVPPAVYLSPKESEKPLPTVGEPKAPTYEDFWSMFPPHMVPKEPRPRRCRDLDELETTAERLYEEALLELRENDGHASYNDFKLANGIFDRMRSLTKGALTPEIAFGSPWGHLLYRALRAAVRTTCVPGFDSPPSAVGWLSGKKPLLIRTGSADPRLAKLLSKTFGLWRSSDYPYIPEGSPPPWVVDVKAWQLRFNDGAFSGFPSEDLELAVDRVTEWTINSLVQPTQVFPVGDYTFRKPLAMGPLAVI